MDNKKIIEALKLNEFNVVKTARDLGLGRSVVRTVLGKYRLYGETAEQVEPNSVLTGTSTLYKYVDENGEMLLKWVKTKPELQAQIESVKRVIESLLVDVPRVEAVPFHNWELEDTLHLITVTDLHCGMYAWDKETGADWDLSICEKVMKDSVINLVSKSWSKTGLLNLQGDLLHYSGLESKTELHGHLLDADSRQPKMIETCVNIIRNTIDTMLSKHEKVIVSIVPGNHDMSATAYLAVILDLLYQKEPRVEVMNNPQPYKVFIFGKTFLGFSHGHLKKYGGLSELFAGKFPREYGQTDHRYLHCGHFHNEKTHEDSMFKTIQHATISSPDAYAANGGWMSKRMIRAITYHRDLGEISNTIVRPEMFI